LQRVGLGADIGLVALIEPAPARAEPAAATAESPADTAPEIPVQPVQQAVETPREPASFSEAFAGISLFDAFAEPVEAPAPTETIEAAAESPVENLPEAIVSPQAEPITAGMVEPPSRQAEPPAPRQHPLRFLWQMDAEGRFVLSSDEFIRLIGAHTAAGFGRSWREIA